MAIPSVNVQILDNSLGVLPASDGLVAVVGPTTAGTNNAPATYGRILDLQADFGSGPAVEAAATILGTTGNAVAIVRTAASVAGTFSSIDATGVTGTSVITLGTTKAQDTYQVVFSVLTDGTVGTAGITFTTSLDAGVDTSSVQSLGTANTYVIPGSGGVTLNFAAGTLKAGDVATFKTTPANFSPADLQAGLNALAQTQIGWGVSLIAGPIDANGFDAIEGVFAGLEAENDPHAYIASVRTPSVGESDAAYSASVSAAFASKASRFGMLCAGADKQTSQITGLKQIRPASFIIAARQSELSIEQDAADLNLGSLPGVSLTDIRGNPDPDCHDARLNPSLDSARFATLRTVRGRQGIYVTRPRVFSADGSDFRLFPHTLVMQTGHKALYQYLLSWLNRDIRVSKTSGFILEADARTIEIGGNAVLAAALLARPSASDALFVLGRRDNLLSGAPMTCTATITPLAYPEEIDLVLSFKNPSLSFVTV